MNIATIQSSAQTKKHPTFKGYISINLSNLPEELGSKVISEVKTQIGEGLIKKAYQFDGKVKENEIFVGFNHLYTKNKASQTNCNKIDAISISTGDDYNLKEIKSSAQAKIKIKQIDMPILNTIKNIFNQLNISKTKYLIDSKISTKSKLGGFTKCSEMVSTNVDYPNGSAFNVYKKDNNRFEHVSTFYLDS